MPKYYCDYCDIYLTHDAPRVRKDHNSGWKHITNVKNYFMDRVDAMQMKLDEIYKAYEVAGEHPAPPPGTVYMTPPTGPFVASQSAALAPASAPGSAPTLHFFPPPPSFFPAMPPLMGRPGMGFPHGLPPPPPPPSLPLPSRPFLPPPPPPAPGFGASQPARPTALSGDRYFQ